MSIEVTNVRFDSSGVKSHETIVQYRAHEDADASKVFEPNKPTAVDWIENKGVVAYVGSGSNRVAVGVVRETGKQPFLRTYADGKYNNNLVNLPTF